MKENQFPLVFLTIKKKCPRLFFNFSAHQLNCEPFNQQLAESTPPSPFSVYGQQGCYSSLMSMLCSSLRVLNYTVTPVRPELGGAQREGTLEGEGKEVHKPHFMKIKKVI